ncbi:hypothetical protein [Nannocystis bainbridge]|uniref:Uncharacterized protein n=1 Tax=Nannocystis bainbridge TaxID=2995303 RepID=A0ABT5DYC4_9BACT|nr:hypothetical protein [Nannocystis bainbridge]MDC0717437.1 hypothetical protein [Nannocystis bainbridge]
MNAATNPILASVQELIDGLDDETYRNVELSVRDHAVHGLGAEISVETELHLILLSKYMAAADGVSGAEVTGLKRLMDRHGLPEVAQRHLLAFDVSEVRPEHVAEVVQPHSSLALYVLSGGTLLAALDGLSPAERSRVRAVGEQLGLSPELVEVVLAEACLTAAALLKGDEAMIQLIRPLRHAIYRLV